MIRAKIYDADSHRERVVLLATPRDVYALELRLEALEAEVKAMREDKKQ